MDQDQTIAYVKKSLRSAAPMLKVTPNVTFHCTRTTSMEFILSCTVLSETLEVMR
jgi:hypothetical protein